MSYVHPNAEHDGKIVMDRETGALRIDAQGRLLMHKVQEEGGKLCHCCRVKLKQWPRVIAYGKHPGECGVILFERSTWAGTENPVHYIIIPDSFECKAPDGQNETSGWVIGKNDLNILGTTPVDWGPASHELNRNRSEYQPYWIAPNLYILYCPKKPVYALDIAHDTLELVFDGEPYLYCIDHDTGAFVFATIGYSPTYNRRNDTLYKYQVEQGLSMIVPPIPDSVIDMDPAFSAFPTQPFVDLMENAMRARYRPLDSDEYDYSTTVFRGGSHFYDINGKTVQINNTFVVNLGEWKNVSFTKSMGEFQG